MNFQMNRMYKYFHLRLLYPAMAENMTLYVYLKKVFQVKMILFAMIYSEVYFL